MVTKKWENFTATLLHESVIDVSPLRWLAEFQFPRGYEGLRYHVIGVLILRVLYFSQNCVWVMEVQQKALYSRADLGLSCLTVVASVGVHPLRVESSQRLRHPESGFFLISKLDPNSG